MGSSFPTKLRRTMMDVTGSRKSNMVTVKPEVIISQLLYGIETKFQGLSLDFRDPAVQ